MLRSSPKFLPSISSAMHTRRLKKTTSNYVDPREAISRLCLSLVHITPGGTVQFTHFSVKESFFSDQIQFMPSVSLFRIEAEMAHTIIAASCLAYLLWIGSMDDIPNKMDKVQKQPPGNQANVKEGSATPTPGRALSSAKSCKAAQVLVGPGQPWSKTTLATSP
ncbi:hypothetical protein B0H13DRAFT_1869964 [Mycena leptocephala]|nr:hypothetical protein B0H13DRAFT_1869964 [Mycena leptocephala]